MTPDAFEAACLALPGTSMVIQWGGTHVYKVGGKIFAMATVWGADDGSAYNFKASDMAFELLIEQGLAVPARYLARAKWVQLAGRDVLPADELSAYLVQAHALIAAKLTRAARKALGLG